jgi:ABC-type lipopolysaccharide export system ATPase subunit
MNVLEIESINLSYGQKVILSDVYLKCETGKIVGLLGRNGTGKSSIFKIIMDVIKAPDKSIRLNHKSISKLKDKSSIVNFLPQHKFIPDGIKVRKAFSDYKVSVDEFVQHFPMFKTKLDAAVRNLSTGEKRIVEVYIIICSTTFFSLLDEPFSYIAPIEIDKMKSIIKTQKATKGFIISDHRYQDVLDAKDDLYLLSNGATTLIHDVNDLKTRGYIP